MEADFPTASHGTSQAPSAACKVSQCVTHKNSDTASSFSRCALKPETLSEPLVISCLSRISRIP